MKPTLCKLALVMSAAGMGLSAADHAEAAVALNTMGASSRRLAVTLTRPPTALFIATALVNAVSPADVGSENFDDMVRGREKLARAGAVPTRAVEPVNAAGATPSLEDEVWVALAMIEIAEPAELWQLGSKRGVPPEELQKPSPSAIELRAPRSRTPMPEALERMRSHQPGLDGATLLAEAVELAAVDESGTSSMALHDAAPGDAIVVTDIERAIAPPPAAATESVEATINGFSCTANASAKTACVDVILVASNEDRVLRSLASLLSGDDPSQGRFGAQTPQPIVATQAEKALLNLAAVHQRHGSKRTTRAVAKESTPAAEQARTETGVLADTESGRVGRVEAPVLTARAPQSLAQPEAAELTAPNIDPAWSAVPELPALVPLDIDPSVTFRDAPLVDILLDVGTPIALSAAALAVDIDLHALSSPWSSLDIDLAAARPASPASAVDIDLPLASAQGPKTLQPPAATPFGPEELQAVSSQALDQVRGGFSTPAGLQVSFGIERAVYVNGNLVTTTSLNLSGLGSGNPVAASVLGSNVALVQNGAGNTFLSGPLNSAASATVVQNTLNDQRIQSVTLINATVNSLQIVRSMNIGSSMQSALIDSLHR